MDFQKRDFSQTPDDVIADNDNATLSVLVSDDDGTMRDFTPMKQRRRRKSKGLTLLLGVALVLVVGAFVGAFALFRTQDRFSGGGVVTIKCRRAGLQPARPG